MDFSILSGALQLIAYLSVMALIAASLGAICAGIFRVVTQIEDVSLSLAGRFIGVVLLLYFFAGTYSGEIIAFTTRLWGGVDVYR